MIRVHKTAIYRSQPVFYRVLGPDRGSQTASTGTLCVLLIHGFAEVTGRIWDEQVEVLKKDFRLILPDLPGSGNSPLPAVTTANSDPAPIYSSDNPITDLSIEDMAEVIKNILDAERIDQAILIGHSMGGYGILAFVEKYPGRCKAFGLFHSTAHPDNDEKKRSAERVWTLSTVTAPPNLSMRSTPNLFAESSRQQHPEWVSRILERYSGFDPKALLSYYQAMIDRPDRTATLAHSTVLRALRHRQTVTPSLPLEANLRLAHFSPPSPSSISWIRPDIWV